MAASSSAAVILGAGFSHAAGLPLTSALFDTGALPRHNSKTAGKNHTQVVEAWRRWKDAYPAANAEEWLRVLYSGTEQMFGTTFERAIRFAVARLVDVPGGSNSAYYYGITTSVNTKDHRSINGEVHRVFWQRIRPTFDVTTVVSMNYDILVEQALKADGKDHRSAPLCHYGGWPTPQHVKTYSNIAKNEYRETKLGSDITLFKMHGSLNWSRDQHAFEIRDHVGAIFRSDNKKGELAIVPPLPEKDHPPWLANVWDYAERALKCRDIWIVCGYSLPAYDFALRDFFRRSALQNPNLQIFILDPFAQELLDRWRDIAPTARAIIPLPGLPTALDDMNWLLITAG